MEKKELFELIKEFIKENLSILIEEKGYEYDTNLYYEISLHLKGEKEPISQQTLTVRP